MKPRRTPARSPAYLAYIRRQPCATCGGGPCEAHHLKIRGTVAMGRKVSDYQAVPLCRDCHRQVHDDPINPWIRADMAETGHRLLVAWVEGRKA